jgi:hypothetical protein
LFPNLEIGESDNFDTLGCPIGNAEHCRKFIEGKLQKVFEMFGSLEKLNNAQIAYTLLRSCCSFGKMTFFLRTIPSLMMSPLCVEFDKRVLTCFENILSLSLDNSSMIQATLPLSKGGLGLRSTRAHASACYIASLGSAKSHSPVPLETDQRCFDDYNSRVSSPLSPDSEPLKQKVLSSRIDEVLLEKLLNSKSMASRARMTGSKCFCLVICYSLS